MANDKEETTKVDLEVLVGSTVDSTAIDFGGDSTLPPSPVLTPTQQSKLWRRIDLRLLPILALMYLMAFMDRANIGNAKLEGLMTQLALKGNEFNVALTVFFIPYCLFEVPANLLLKRVRPSRWLPGLTISWGTVMISMGLLKSYPLLVASRLSLGAVEAGLFPGIAYYLTFWYPRDKLQMRIGLIFGSASLAGAFSGILAYAIGFMSGTGGLLGWSWIFVLEGLITVVVGLIAYFLVVDFPATAKFLTPEHRAFVIRQKKFESSTVGEEEQFETRHLWAALTDWQVWLHTLILTSVVTPLYGITFFLPSIINDFGHTTAVSQLLTVPPYVLGSTYS